MAEEIKLPAFEFLGHHLQRVDFTRIGREQVEEITIGVAGTKYDEKKRVYSLVLFVKLDFQQSKDNRLELLGGFKINDEKILEDKDQLHSVFAASLYPYMRTLLHSLSCDDRPPISLPTLDLRNINLEKSISLKPRKDKASEKD